MDNRIDWEIIIYINQWLNAKYKSLVTLLYFDLNDKSWNCVSTTDAVFNCTAYLFFFWLIELINTLSKQQVTPTLVQRQYDLKTLSEGSSVTIHAYNQIWKKAGFAIILFTYTPHSNGHMWIVISCPSLISYLLPGVVSYSLFYHYDFTNVNSKLAS